MFAGLRVVRGPDWKWGDQDGGYGCVGTVVTPDADIESDTMVRWDSGEMANYRAGGASGKFDLRIFDNAQLGVKHLNIICDGCRQEGIVGIRWKCLECFDFDLCHVCYNKGEHELSHRFTRIETSSAPGFPVVCRQGDTRCRSYGIFHGARVVRGPDWQWGNQDGGDGIVGTVGEAVDAQGTYRSWVSVLWPNGSSDIYRVGHQGKVDLQYTEKETAGEFYIDHLPVFNVANVRSYVNAGDKVRLEVSAAKLKELHSKGCRCRQDITNLRGKVGTIVRVDKDKDIEVDFGGSSHFIHPLCFVAVREGDEGEEEKREENPTHISPSKAQDVKSRLVSVKPGDKVRLMEMDLSVIKEMQLQSCGWHDQIPKFMGKVGKVIMIDKDGDIKVDFGELAIFINPACLAPMEEGRQTYTSPVAFQFGLEVPLMTGSFVLGPTPIVKPDCSSPSVGGEALFIAAVNGNNAQVREIIRSNRDLVTFQNNKGQTPMHAAARHGHVDAVKALLLGNAPLEQRDENGDTALSYAVAGDKPDIISLLLINGSNINASSKTGMTPLHLAADHGHLACAEVLLKHEQKPCDVNFKDNNGNTPLFLAITKKNTNIIQILLQQRRLDYRLTNKKGFNILHHAAFNNNNLAVQKILSVYPFIMNNTTNEGFTALHIAAFNGFREIVLTLVRQASCNKNVRSVTGRTPLHMTIEKCQIECMVALVDSGTEVNARDNDGNTALHLVVVQASVHDIIRATPLGQLADQLVTGAAVANDERAKLIVIAAYLIDHGADIRIKNNEGLNVPDLTLNPGLEMLLTELYKKKK